MFRFTALLLLLLTFSTATFAAVHSIRPDGTGDFPTIQSAVIAFGVVAEGDTIELADGIFTGNGNRDIFFAGRSLVLRSASGDPETCVIDCEGSALDQHRGFDFVCGSEGAVLEGLTVRNGYALGEGPSGFGGAVLCRDGAAPTLLRCVFRDNFARYGGAVLTEGESQLTLVDCRFEGNEATNEGGGLMCMFVNVAMSGCVFADNRAPIGGGAEIVGDPYLYRSSPITNCRFEYNKATQYAGGFYAVFDEILLEDCVFTGNQAAYMGAGLYYGSQPLVEAFLRLTRCEFTENRVSESYPDGWSGGGGVALQYGDAVIEHCTFTGNSADNEGGGAIGLHGASPEIVGCTLVGNGAINEGGGIYCATLGLAGPVGSDPVIRDTVIAFGTAGGAIYCEGFSDPVLSCSDLYGNAGGDWTGCLWGQENADGNFSADPLFCDLAAGDLTLADVSPCLPAGNECGVQIGAHGQGCILSATQDGTAPARLAVANHPNPFNPATTIVFTLPAGGLVELAIYDALGRRVCTLLDESLVAGHHEHVWNGRDDSGAPVSSGVYFAQVSFGAEKQTAKLLLLE